MSVIPGEVVTGAVSDILTALNLPGAGTVAALIDRHLRKKATAATSVLIEEVRNGGINILDAVEQDEFISCLWRFHRAAIEGSARQNMRLLARMLAGLADANSPPLYAEKFKRYADALADLSREEILVLAELHKICTAFGARENFYAGKSMRRLVARLVPNRIASEIELHGILAGLSRTGLISQGSGTMDDIGGWMTTPLMDEVAALSRIDDLGGD